MRDSDIEIVHQALETARQNGWNILHSNYTRVFKDADTIMIEFVIQQNAPSVICDFEKILFSHDFAENFFGMDTMYFVVDIDRGPGMENVVIGWKTEKELQQHSDAWRYYDDAPAYEYHLQQLVLLPSQRERINYLEEFMKQRDAPNENTDIQ